MKKSELVKIIKEAVIAKRALKEEKEKSVDDLWKAVVTAIETDSDDDTQLKKALKDLGTGVLQKAKNKVKKGAEKLKTHLEKN